MEVSTSHCRNCDSPLDGQYCAGCGQREGRGDLHFAEAATDILGDVFTWDSRLWRTLIPLLIRPGFLSAEFNAGRRMRYMPPFRLYIVVSFLMFLAMSFAAEEAGFSFDDSESGEVAVTLSGSDTDPDVSKADEPRESAQPEGFRTKVDEALQRELEVSKAAGDEDAGLFIEELESTIEPGADGKGLTINLMENGPPWVEALEDRIETNARRVSESPNDYIDDLMEHLPQVMFVLLPVFALLLKLAFLFSPYHYLQHLVFALHYHTFVYLLYLINSAFEYLTLKVDGLFALMLILYLPLALRRTYSSSWVGAIIKSTVLMFSYGAALLLGVATAAFAVLAVM